METQSPKSIPNGLFIVLDGADGTGKSTCVPLIKKYFDDKGYTTLTTKEPGGCPASEAIRSVLLSQEMSPQAQILLAWAARMEHLKNTIIPALKRGEVVICDRFWDSTWVYQVAMDKVSHKESIPIFEEHVASVMNLLLKVGKTVPDLTIFLTADRVVTEGRRRARNASNGTDVFEAKPESYHADVAAFFRDQLEAYHEMEDEEKWKIKGVDSTFSVEETWVEIEKILDAHLAGIGR